MLKYAEKGYFCDSIIKLKDEQDSLLKIAIDSKNNQLEISARTIHGKNLIIKRQRICIAGVSVGGLFLFVLGVLI